MKSYYCKICSERGKQVTGTRIMIREHLREIHGVKGKRSDISGEKAYMKSLLTRDTGVIEDD